MVFQASTPGSARLLAVASVALAALVLLIPATVGRAGAAEREVQGQAVLPCGKDIVLTAAFRTGGWIRFEGIVKPGLENRAIRIERQNGETVATTRTKRDGTFWALAETENAGFTWLSRFTAYIGENRSRARRLGQAVAIRDREAPADRSRTRIKVKVSGDSADRIVIGRQTGCSRHEVLGQIKMKTNGDGVAEFTVPRPAEGDPYSIYRVTTTDGWKISPPIVIKPSSGRN